MRLLAPLLILVLFVGKISGQITNLAAIYDRSDQTFSYLLFINGNMKDAFVARSYDLAQDHPRLMLSGDFTGDGVDELAIFNDLEYTPNMNPDFTCSVVSVSRSKGDQFLPSGSWYSILDTQLDFENVSFSVAGDYNMDGLCDIALFYNDPALELLTIYLLESTGSGFLAAQDWYSVNRNEFNFTALKFASPGDFNGNGLPDIAVFYNYFGTAPETKQSVFLFESEGDSFSLLPVAYDATKASYDFSHMKFALSGDYNLDGHSDVAVLFEDPLDLDLIIPVFEGSVGGQLSPSEYISFLDSEPELSHVLHAAGGNFAGDTATDLALFYDNPGTGSQEILVLESDLSSFKAPDLIFSTDAGSLSMADITTVQSGTFIHQAVVTAANWKDDRPGAISFTFDDGYRGAFEHGGAELEAAGLKGTFYIFTDTSLIYDGELASTSLVREYKDKGHEIASHTANHSNLGLLTESGDLDSLNEVLSTSVELLNERFDQYTMSMSIPFGSFRYETLDYIAQYFYSARSSQYGFNLATPYDFFALKSWPILSTTSPAYVDNLLSIAESYGTYLPLMYHDMTDEPFDEESLIYTYSRALFSETVQSVLNMDLWVDTNERIYKYMRQRNALKILQMESGDKDAQPGHFSFEADDGLADSIFNVEITLKIFVPESWTGDTVTVGPEGEYKFVKVQQDSSGPYILYDWLPTSGKTIAVQEGKITGTGFNDHLARPEELSLVSAPNPFLHETRITVTGNGNTDGFLIVRDIHGRIVQEIREHSGATFHLPRADLSPGIYIIQLIDSGKQVASLKIFAL
jgi:peptidoglycan/xylan/chitin deacetylase (PgdA/CDA1 family)